MAFRFSLQTVLQFRQSLEHQEELRLRIVNQSLQKIRHQIEQIDSCRMRAEQVLSDQIARGTTGAEILAELETKLQLEQQRRHFESELSRLENVRKQQQHHFQEARRQRQTLDNLRDHRRHEYVRETARQQQRILDDLYLASLANTRRG